MKPEAVELDRLRREVARLKAKRDILKKGRGVLRAGVDMKFGLIAKHRPIWPVSWMCAALGVSCAGFHARLTRKPSARDLGDAAIGARVRASFLGSDRPCGARRV